MYIDNTVTDIDVLEIFHIEAERFDEAIRNNFNVEVLRQDGELFPSGTRIYKHIDPIIERGIVATSRLLIVKGETSSFQSVCKLVNSELRAERRLKLELLKLSFCKLRKNTNEILDMFWNVEHLHKDISDHRFQTYFNLRHSCAGPGVTTRLYDTLIEMNSLISKLDGDYVRPVLQKEGRLN